MFGDVGEQVVALWSLLNSGKKFNRKEISAIAKLMFKDTGCSLGRNNISTARRMVVKARRALERLEEEAQRDIEYAKATIDEYESDKLANADAIGVNGVSAKAYSDEVHIEPDLPVALANELEKGMVALPAPIIELPRLVEGGGGDPAPNIGPAGARRNIIDEINALL